MLRKSQMDFFRVLQKDCTTLKKITLRNTKQNFHKMYFLLQVYFEKGFQKSI